MPSNGSSTQRAGFPVSFTIFLFLHLAGASVVAQPAAPGGVAGPLIWVRASEAKDARVVWQEMPGGRFSASPGRRRLLNYHPLPVIAGQPDAFRLPLKDAGLARSTIIAIHQPTDTLTEKVVWSVVDGATGAASLVLTTHRFADLGTIEYRNFVDLPKDRPGIKTYFQHKSAEENPWEDPVLLIGAPPASPVLPVEPYHGLMPEVIVYDRVLSPAERTKVESYLALKYGLTLSPQVNYLNAAGEVIWDATAHGAFSQRIAGIGRDDAGSLYQKQSTSSYKACLLTIGVGEIASQNQDNKAAIPDRTFLIWGDDGAMLNLQEEKFAHQRRLGRTWLMSSQGEGPALSTTVRFDLGRLATERSPDEIYWLLIDRSGTGQFPAGMVDYYPMNEMVGRELAIFRDIHWDTDASGADCFTVGIARGFTGIAWLDEPVCQPLAPGRLQVGAAGGRPPYRFQLQGPRQQWQWESDNSAPRPIEDLEAGLYQLIIQDADGAVFSDSLFLQNADGPEVEYTLTPGSPMVLSAVPPGGSQVHYYWEGPDDVRATGARLEVQIPGLYRLTVDQEGCLAQRTILIEELPADPYRDLTVYPNPAKAGQPFQLALTLRAPAEVTMTICDVSGRQIRQHRLEMDEYHLVQEKLPVAGTYLISLQAGMAMRTLPVVVE